MTAAAVAALASCRAPPIQLLTVTEIVDIDELLEDPRGEGWFTKNIRCSRVTFFVLLEFLRSRNFEFKSLTHKEHSFAKRVAGVLYFLASSGTYRATASSIGMNESVLFESVDELTAFLVGILDEVVKFPDILGDWRRIEHGFKRKKGIPGVIGAVDGTLFQIQRPADYEGFDCWKGYTAINMQAIVDTDLKFMAIDMYPGSWSDKKVWNFAPSSSLVRTEMPVETHLIGDSGYTLYPRLLTPFIEREEGGRLSDR
ncbi:hypothetical protein ON010_g13325 [Phytophthora cinnamomi]|nr:hypothetical protein ON010_g13325 [Phytophthora cinnamomi]